MARQSNLRLVGPDTLRQPTLFVAQGADWNPEAHPTLEAIAARLVELAPEGLRIAPAATDAYHCDVAPFKGHAVYRLRDGAEDWFGCVALLGRAREALEAAVRQAADRAAA